MPRPRGRAAVVFFNALWTGIGLSVVVLAAECWARSKGEFYGPQWKYWVHPKAGFLYVPGSEVRHTNMLDGWTISHVNRWGFLDRPPPPDNPRAVVPRGRRRRFVRRRQARLRIGQAACAA